MTTAPEREQMELHITYTIYSADLPSATDVDDFAQRLEAAIQTEYPTATVKVVTRDNVTGVGAGVHVEGGNHREHESICAWIANTAENIVTE